MCRRRSWSCKHTRSLPISMAPPPITRPSSANMQCTHPYASCCTVQVPIVHLRRARSEARPPRRLPHALPEVWRTAQNTSPNSLRTSPYSTHAIMPTAATGFTFTRQPKEPVRRRAAEFFCTPRSGSLPWQVCASLVTQQVARMEGPGGVLPGAAAQDGGPGSKGHLRVRLPPARHPVPLCLGVLRHRGLRRRRQVRSRRPDGSAAIRTTLEYIVRCMRDLILRTDALIRVKRSRS